MASDANFCGDRLRLVAFLRVVENLPQQPSRFGRHRHVHLEEQAPQVHSPEGTPRASPSEPPKNAMSGAKEAPPPPGIAAIDQDDNIGTWTGPCSAVESAPMDPNPTESFSMSSQYSSESNTIQQQPGPLPVPLGLHKDVTVYKSRGYRTNRSTAAFSNTRKGRLPVQELALLRTTTDNGLPEPSGTETAFNSSMLANDPIQDTQLIPTTLIDEESTRPPLRNRAHADDSSRSGDIIPGSNSSETLHSPSNHQSKNTNSSTWSSKKTKAVHGHPKGYAKRPRLDYGLKSVSDGFVGTESAIPLARQFRRKMPQREKKETDRNGGLTLVEGCLPPLSIERTASEEDMFSRNIASASQLETLMATSRISIPMGIRKDAPLNLSVKAEENRILHQFSSITAPMREGSADINSDSDVELFGRQSEHSDADGTSVSDGTDMSNSDFTAQDQDVETSYFQDASYHLHGIPIN
ncbi:hypothetical protein BDV95DRAFT_592817 [Massariosphaeria phaeospora]|uniref:Uncharacterized protein n=1 Tax=Massariosphaeria phaeospora TaxID=100035 RepID=A0A7C8IDD5_9PLEO|nr:hypothetical protein BDV95DRAFT_592817 [Massariosphaeria phaeospora]